MNKLFVIVSFFSFGAAACSGPILDKELIEKCRPALEDKEPVELNLSVRNINRTVGTMLSGEIALRHGHDGLPEDTIVLNFQGSAGLLIYEITP